MSKWFPHVDDREGIQEALKAGFFGTIAFAVMICIGIAFVIFAGELPNSGDQVSNSMAALVGMLVELMLVLVAAWRFKIGKGLVWGGLILLMFAAEVIGKIIDGTTNIGWLFAYAAIGCALINGLRGAWAQRTMAREHSEAFE
jgi:hypothetical protein